MLTTPSPLTRRRCVLSTTGHRKERFGGRRDNGSGMIGETPRLIPREGWSGSRRDIGNGLGGRGCEEMPSEWLAIHTSDLIDSTDHWLSHWVVCAVLVHRRISSRLSRWEILVGSRLQGDPFLTSEGLWELHLEPLFLIKVSIESHLPNKQTKRTKIKMPTKMEPKIRISTIFSNLKKKKK